MPTIGIDSRGGGGPAWSPDGTKMAAIYEGTLAVWPVAVTGEPLGPPRHVTTESAHSPSWAGDSHHILYQSLDKLRIVDIETGETRTVPLDLKYTPAVPTTHVVVHAGKLVDMKAPTCAYQRRRDHRRQPDYERRAARGRESHRSGRRRVEPLRDAGADGVPLPSAAGFRRVAGPRVSRVRHHDGPKSRQHAVRGGRRARGERGRRASRPARLRHRLPDGMAARVLQDGHRDLERLAVRDGAAARESAAARSHQELRPAAGSSAEADGGVRAQHRRSGGDARDLPGGVRRRRQHRAHLRDQPARLLAEDGDAVSAPTRTSSSCSARASGFSAR